MIAIDTNVVVRFLTRDEPKQSALADGCVGEGVFVSDSVLMETEWVLRRAYGWQRARINHALRTFVAIEQVSVAQTDHIIWGLDRHLDGADLADMMHLIAARGQSCFATFDRKLAGLPASGSPLPVQLLG
jgi:predicted nucleic-acid-binding protein